MPSRRAAPDPLELIARRGGLAATHEFAANGISRARLTALLRHGRVVRVRQGWYGQPGLHPELLSAARVGGRLTCGSALRLAGFWAVNDHHLHVAVQPHDCQLRSPHDHRRRLRAEDDVTVHWRDSAANSPSRLLQDPVSALADLASCATPEPVTASADSVIHERPGLLPRIRRLARELDSSARAALLDADGICESGTETLFWLRMRRLAPRRQVIIAGVGRVDFVFGSRLIVEIDGAAFHAGRTAFESDRRRDAWLSARGYRVLRFSYHQVLDRWTEVHTAVMAAILRGDLGS